MESFEIGFLYFVWRAVVLTWWLDYFHVITKTKNLIQVMEMKSHSHIQQRLCMFIKQTLQLDG